MSDFLTDFQFVAYELAQGGTFRGILAGGLVLAVLLPAVLDLFDWRR